MLAFQVALEVDSDVMLNAKTVLQAQHASWETGLICMFRWANGDFDFYLQGSLQVCVYPDRICNRTHKITMDGIV